jgi:hypothetical protein
MVCDTNWVDNEGYSCKEYAKEKWCTSNGKQGSGWEDRWGTISDFTNKGKSALQACCECGGGKVAAAGSDTSVASTNGKTRELTVGEITGIFFGIIFLIIIIVLAVDLAKCRKAYRATGVA